MKTATIVVLGLLLLGAPANAHEGGFGGFGGFGGLGFGGHHGRFDGLGGLAFGFGFLDPERAQERFETRFESLQTSYDEGVADIEDFFNSTEYDNILDRTDLLTDRYGFFVSGVERSIDRLGDVISIVEDDVTYFSDLLADFQANEDFSAARLERIETWINRITDRLNSKIDLLADKQTTLETNLPTYQTFQTELETFLTDITAAGGGTTDEAAGLKALGSSASLMATMLSDEVECASTSLEPNSVPEPSTGILVLLAGGGASIWGRRRARQS